MKRNCSYHVTNDRLDRINYIIENIGFGEVIAEREWVDTAGKACIRQLTNTGLIIVLDANREKVVTMFVATVMQIKSMYFGKIANWLYKLAIKNEKIMKGYKEKD